MKPFTRIAVIILALIAIVHLERLIAGWDLVVGGFAIPVWWSLVGVVIPGALAFLVWHENQAATS